MANRLVLTKKSFLACINRLRLSLPAAVLLACAVGVDADAGQATLTLAAPTTYTDGTQFTDLKGLNVHIGTSPGKYTQSIDVGNVTSYTATNLAEGSTYYFAATAYDSLGNESAYSNEMSKAIAAGTQYALTVTKTGTGSGTVTGTAINCGTACTASYVQGTVVALTATPGTGSIFSGWSGGACSGTGPCTVTINGAVGVTASFGKAYTITATAGAGGTITTSGGGTVSTATSGSTTIYSVAVNQGTSQSFTMKPNAGYRITDVQVNGASVGAVGTYTFSTITANHTLNAVFAPSSTFTITASAGTGGTISPSGATTVTSGASQTYGIAPSSGYTIADVKVDGVSVGRVASYSFSSVTANHSIAATFAPSNLLSNGGFESGTLTGWVNGGGIAISSQARFSGTFGAKMTNTGRIDQVFATTPGRTYYVSGRIRVDQQYVAPGWGGLAVQINDSNWKQLAVSPYLSKSNSPLGSWTPVRFSFVATTAQTRLVYQNFSKGQFAASADDFTVSAAALP